MDYPSSYNFGTCSHGTRFHLAEGCECEGCLIDQSDRPQLAEHGWSLDEGNMVGGELVWTKRATIKGQKVTRFLMDSGWIAKHWTVPVKK